MSLLVLCLLTISLFATLTVDTRQKRRKFMFEESNRLRN